MDPFINLKHIVTIEGKKEPIPKLSWKREVKVLKLLADAFSEVPELAANLGGQEEDINILKVVPTLLNKLPDTVTNIVSTLTGKENDWVEENLDSDQIIDLLTPFFGKLINKLSNAVAASKSQNPGLKKKLQS